MSKKIYREMRDHPERFDYGDCLGAISVEQQAIMDAQMDEMRPQWLKDMIANEQTKSASKGD